MDHQSRQAVQAQEREALILRVLWMLVFFCVWQLAELILLGSVVVQLGLRLLHGKPSPELSAFGDSLSQYIAQIGRFGSFATEDKPWPLSAWPAPASPEDQRLGS